MRRICNIVLMVLLFALLHPSYANTCGIALTTPLIAGQNMEAGSVTIANDTDTITVTIETTAPWLLQESHVHLATTLEGIPQTRSGNPQVGQFDYAQIYDPLLTSDTYTIVLSEHNWSADEGTSLVIAIHAVVVNTMGVEPFESETAWGQGLDFPGNSWAMHLQYTLQACDAEPPASQNLWRTQTQGGWGSLAKGNNPGALRDQWFASVFPIPLAIGSDDGFATLFTSSTSVACFLPESGTPAPLTVSAVDPALDASGCIAPPDSYSVLAGQVLALSLNVAFDAFCEANINCDFGGNEGNSETLLADLIVVDEQSPCHQMSVADVLSLANGILSGADSTLTASSINDCASSINENFVDGSTNGGYLAEAPFD